MGQYFRWQTGRKYNVIKYYFYYYYFYPWYLIPKGLHINNVNVARLGVTRLGVIRLVKLLLEESASNANSVKSSHSHGCTLVKKIGLSWIRSEGTDETSDFLDENMTLSNNWSIRLNKICYIFMCL